MKKLVRFLRLPFHDRLNFVVAALVQFKTAVYYARVFGSIGQGSRIYKPMLLVNPRFMYLGEKVMIRPGARMEVLNLDGEPPASIVIGNNVNIEQNSHFVCGRGVVIGDNVSIAPNCAILDTKHPFRDMDDTTKVGDRVEPGTTPIVIGRNTLIGFGSIVLPNVQIGRNCVIGANSTVRSNVPDFCVAAGNPASVIMRYDFKSCTWLKDADHVPTS